MSQELSSADEEPKLYTAQDMRRVRDANVSRTELRYTQHDFDEFQHKVLVAATRAAQKAALNRDGLEREVSGNLEDGGILCSKDQVLSMIDGRLGQLGLKTKNQDEINDTFFELKQVRELNKDVRSYMKRAAYGTKVPLSKRGFADHKPGEVWVSLYCIDLPETVKPNTMFIVEGMATYPSATGLWFVSFPLPSFAVPGSL